MAYLPMKNFVFRINCCCFTLRNFQMNETEKLEREDHKMMKEKIMKKKEKLEKFQLRMIVSAYECTANREFNIRDVRSIRINSSNSDKCCRQPNGQANRRMKCIQWQPKN